MMRAHVIPVSKGWSVRVLGQTLVVEATELAAEQAGHAHLIHMVAASWSCTPRTTAKRAAGSTTPTNSPATTR